MRARDLPVVETYFRVRRATDLERAEPETKRTAGTVQADPLKLTSPGERPDGRTLWPDGGLH